MTRIYTQAEEEQQRAEGLAGLEVKPATAQDWINATIGAPMSPVAHVRTDKVVKQTGPAPDFWALQA